MQSPATSRVANLMKHEKSKTHVLRRILEGVPGQWAVAAEDSKLKLFLASLWYSTT